MTDGELGNALEIEVEPDIQGRTVVVAHGVIDLREVPDLYEVLMRVCESDCPGVVVDLTDVTFVGSSGLGVFVQVQQELSRTRRRLVIKGASASIHKAFVVTQLDRVIDFEDADDGAHGFAGPHGAHA